MVLELSGVIAGVAVAISLAAIWWTFRLQKRISTALATTDGDTLEETLKAHIDKVGQVDKRLSQLEVIYRELAEMTALASQKISVVRFNPFGDTGGDQSFTLAVLDAQNSGYILTSIHGREGTRVYVKPIDYGKSKYTLSVEEKKALAQAAKRVPQK